MKSFLIKSVIFFTFVILVCTAIGNRIELKNLSNEFTLDSFQNIGMESVKLQKNLNKIDSTQIKTETPVPEELRDFFNKVSPGTVLVFFIAIISGLIILILMANLIRKGINAISDYVEERKYSLSKYASYEVPDISASYGHTSLSERLAYLSSPSIQIYYPQMVTYPNNLLYYGYNQPFQHQPFGINFSYHNYSGKNGQWPQSQIQYNMLTRFNSYFERGRTLW